MSQTHSVAGLEAPPASLGLDVEPSIGSQGADPSTEALLLSLLSSIGGGDGDGDAGGGSQ